MSGEPLQWRDGTSNYRPGLEIVLSWIRFFTLSHKKKMQSQCQDSGLKDSHMALYGVEEYWSYLQFHYKSTVEMQYNDLEGTGEFWLLNLNVVKSNYKFLSFLVACYATLHPLCWSICQSIGPSVGPSVHPSHYFFWVFEVYGLIAPAQVR